MKYFKLKSLAAGILAGLSIFSLAACGSQGTTDQKDNSSSGQTEQQQQTDNNNTSDKGEIIFGTSADYAPYEFHTMINGVDTIVGSDIELAKKIAEDMGKELVIKDIAFDVLLNELQNGTIDFVIAAMASNEERLAQADASTAYHSDDYQRVVMKAEDADKYTSFDDFEGSKVAVQSGAIQVGLAEENLTGCELLVLQSVPDMFNNLINGKCDAVLVDGSVAEGYVESNDGLVILDKDFPPIDGSCVWVQKGDPEGILDSINSTIESVLNTDQYKTWLADAEELAGE